MFTHIVSDFIPQSSVTSSTDKQNIQVNIEEIEKIQDSRHAHKADSTASQELTAILTAILTTLVQIIENFFYTVFSLFLLLMMGAIMYEILIGIYKYKKMRKKLRKSKAYNFIMLFMLIIMNVTAILSFTYHLCTIRSFWKPIYSGRLQYKPTNCAPIDTIAKILLGSDVYTRPKQQTIEETENDQETDIADIVDIGIEVDTGTADQVTKEKVIHE